MSANPRSPSRVSTSIRSVEQLLQQALQELQQRVQQGELRVAESLFDRWPGIAIERDAALELIYTEFVLHQEKHGDADVSEWIGRFPQWQKELAEVFQVDRLVRNQAGVSELATQGLSDLDTWSPGDPVCPDAPGRIGDYELLEEVGRGGMGVVYRARQLGLDRIVAVKLIAAHDMTDIAARARFRAEAEAAAQLQHPHIVQIYEVGGQDDLPYFSMEYVAGGSLATMSQQHPFTPRQSAKLVECLARAVGYAHSQGVIHRDLKPANILLRVEAAQNSDRTSLDDLRWPGSWDGNLEPLSVFSAKITDFGLAKRIDLHENRTLPGNVLGTPSYMAPEQASLGQDDVGTACDIYALGAVLYDLLVGRPPFRGATPLETLEHVRNNEPISPRSLQPEVSRDLETICLKCLQKDPRRRYARSSELADDLRRFLDQRPISARSPSWPERCVKWARRRPAVAALLVSMMVGCFGIAWQWLRAEVNLASAQLQTAAAEAARHAVSTERQRLEHLLYAHDVRLAHHEQASHNTARAKQLLEACPKPLRHWEWEFVQKECSQEFWAIPPMPISVQRVAFSQDGRLVAACTGLFGINTAGEIRVWDAESGQQVYTLRGHPHSIMDVAFNHDGTRLASAGMSWQGVTPKGSIRLWDMANGNEVLSIDDVNVYAIAFSPDGAELASAESTHRLVLYDSETGAKVSQLAGHRGSVFDLVYSSDGRHLASASYDGTCRIWEPATHREVLQQGGLGDVRSVTFSPDAARLAVGTWTGRVKIFRFLEDKLAEVATFERAGPIRSLAFSPDGQYLATAVFDEGVQLWDARTSRVHRVLRGHNGRPMDLAFSRNGRWLATGGVDGGVKLWDLAKESIPRILYWNDRPMIAQAVFHPNCEQMVVASGFNYLKSQVYPDKSAKLVNLENADIEKEFVGHSDWLTCVDVNRRGDQIVTGSDDRTVRIWDTSNGQTIHILQGHTESVTFVAFANEGRDVVSASRDGTLRLWNARDGTSLVVWNPGKDRLACVASRWDDALVASAAEDGSIRLWRREADHPVATCSNTGSDPRDLAFSPDGMLLAVAGGDATIAIWNVADILSASADAPLVVMRGHTDALIRVAFSPDAKRLVSTSHDRALKLWDTESGLELLSLHPQFGHHAKALFSPNGRQIAFVEGTRMSIYDLGREVPADDAVRRNAIDGELERVWHTLELANAERARNGFAKLFHLESLLAAQPGNTPLRMQHGFALAQLGRWKEAQRELETVVSTQDSVPTQYFLALLSLYNGDVSKYRTACMQLRELSIDTMDRNAANTIAWTCALSEHSEVDGPTLISLAEMALSDPPGPDQLNTLSLAQYRSRQFEQSLDTIATAIERRGLSRIPHDQIVLALSHQALRQHEQAAGNRQAVADWLDEQNERLKDGEPTDGMALWNQRLELELLLREFDAIDGR